MAIYTLTVVDTSGIQDYIFGSNVLAHNVGASELVRRATQDWVYQTLVNLGTTNVDLEGKTNEHTIDGHGLASELVYAGGGNAVILFESCCRAVEFTRSLSKAVLLEAPGLQVVVAHRDFDWQEQALVDALDQAFKDVGRKKRDRPRSSPLLGLAVTASCQYTGLPAVELHKEPQGNTVRVSAEIDAKLGAADRAHQRLKRLLLPETEEPYDFPRQFVELGGTAGESSYIAVVHSDGNGMGARVQDIADAHRTPRADRPYPDLNRSYIQAIRAFSRSVSDASLDALKATVLRVIGSIDRDHKGRKVIGQEILLRQNDTQMRATILPMRPIIYGGDDTTFVCDGRLGLPLAEAYLRELTSPARPLKDGKGSIAARAGIAVVKSHYPFARAYELADDLVKSAKGYIANCKSKYGESGLSALDWHFAVSGLVRELGELRDAEYRVRDGDLYMRPVRLGDPTPHDWRSWSVFQDIVQAFLSDDWRERRNKVKALRTALRDGPDAVKQFLALNGLRLPAAPAPWSSLAESGWEGKRCGYFDAVEALDFYVPLRERRPQ